MLSKVSELPDKICKLFIRFRLVTSTLKIVTATSGVTGCVCISCSTAIQRTQPVAQLVADTIFIVGVT